MAWYQLEAKDGAKLEELAKQFNLHSLHVEDCIADQSRIKIEETADYLFIILKPLRIVDEEIKESLLHLFIGRDFCITMGDMACPSIREAMDRAWRAGSDTPPSKLLYLIFDTIVDSYFVTVDHLDDHIDLIEDDVLDDPSPEILSSIFDNKRQLIDLRRIIVATRDVGMHLQRDAGDLVDDSLYPFFRDIYDHLLRLADTIDTLRDLLNNTLDVYLSSVANRTNQVMKVLTIMSTIALPALVISGIYGMNVKGVPFMDSNYGALFVAALMVGSTSFLLLMLRRMKWL